MFCFKVAKRLDLKNHKEKKNLCVIQSLQYNEPDIMYVSYTSILLKSKMKQFMRIEQNQEQ